MKEVMDKAIQNPTEDTIFQYRLQIQRDESCKGR